MEFSDVIKYRSSVRDYSDKEVEEDIITYILECARLAPSAMNRQSWRFIVIKNKEIIAHIAKTSLINRWLKKAPVLIIVCADPTLSGTHNNIDYYIIDFSIAMEHLILAATDKGLGTCWIGRFNEEEVKTLLEIPKRIRVGALTPLGYPLGTKGIVETITTMLLKSKKRKKLDEIVHYERW
jgi:nitroreductase